MAGPYRIRYLDAQGCTKQSPPDATLRDVLRAAVTLELWGCRVRAIVDQKGEMDWSDVRALEAVDHLKPPAE
jgi:phage FluMu gp28-like protein